MSLKYHIVYPRGDKSRLAVVEIVDALSYELSDYSVASRQSFDTYKDAADYAKELAEKNNKTYVPDSDEEDYLD